MNNSLGFTYKLGEPTVVPDLTKNPVYACFPDAHITVGPHPEQAGRCDLALDALQIDVPCYHGQTFIERASKTLDRKQVVWQTLNTEVDGKEMQGTSKYRPWWLWCPKGSSNRI